MKVLLATDGSASATAAAKFLDSLWRESGTELTILTVSPDPAKLAMSYVPVASDWRKQEEQRVQQYHAETQDTLKNKFKNIETVHKIGDTATEILALAKEIPADLIVLGSVGHSVVHRLFLGSVSDRVATHADCSVLVVRPSEEQFTPGEKVLVAYDGSGPSKRAIDEIMELPWKPPAEVSVLTVLQEYQLMAGDGFEATALVNDPSWIDWMNRENQSMVDRISKTVPNAKSVVIQSQHIGNAIVESCEENKTPLIVIGDAGHNMMEDLLLGSTTKFVLRHSPCSVWISRHHQNELDTAEDSESQSEQKQSKYVFGMTPRM